MLRINPGVRGLTLVSEYEYEYKTGFILLVNPNYSNCSKTISLTLVTVLVLNENISPRTRVRSNQPERSRIFR